MKQPAAYIMASRRNGTIYTGVTSDLVQRVWQHREGKIGFTARYGCKMLVWYELQQLKAGSRKRKLALIEAMNPDWADLWETIVH